MSEERTKTLIDGPSDAPRTFVFAHGAGGPMDSPFMARVAAGIADHGIRVVRFEFPYMAARRSGVKKSGAPDRQPKLLEAWRGVIRDFGDSSALVIGGKSLGGRMATMVADEAGVRGVVCFGYPFHPPADPSRLRTAHLESIVTPVLILQGSRDPFGTRDEVAAYHLSPSIRIEWLEDGDHSFKTRKAARVTETEHMAHAVEQSTRFIESVT